MQKKVSPFLLLLKSHFGAQSGDAGCWMLDA